MQTPFIGRKRELALLERLWNMDSAQFLVLYGRRRVGKTALLIHWMKQSQKRVLYWTAAPTSELAQLRSFSQALFNFAHPGAPAPESFTYATWEQAWQEVAHLAEKERLALFIDEFTYLLEVTPGIAGQLQNLWDQRLKDCSLFLCLSGSHIGMMKREFLSYQAPLYGRATAQLHLQPLAFGWTSAYFPKYDAAERVALYALFGGVPAYWERVEPGRSISQNIRFQLLTPHNLMQAEPRLLLQDFISEPHNYLAVLTAIANGFRTLKEIATYTGLPNVQVPKYLSVLNHAGFVERRVSVTLLPSARSGRYQITDPYLRFYFRFLVGREDQFALGIQDQALAEIKRHLIDFIGTHTWEELSREWLLRAGASGELPFLPDEVGSAWTAGVQIDVAGINRMQKTLILGECKWTTAAVERGVLVSLVEEKTARIVPGEGNWRVYYLGFSRCGWTDAARAYQQEIQSHPPSGKNWTVTDLRLLDLEQVDDALQEWTTALDLPAVEPAL